MKRYCKIGLYLTSKEQNYRLQTIIDFKIFKIRTRITPIFRDQYYSHISVQTSVMLIITMYRPVLLPHFRVQTSITHIFQSTDHNQVQNKTTLIFQSTDYFIFSYFRVQATITLIFQSTATITLIFQSTDQ